MRHHRAMATFTRAQTPWCIILSHKGTKLMTSLLTRLRSRFLWERTTTQWVLIRLTPYMNSMLVMSRIAVKDKSSERLVCGSYKFVFLVYM